MTLLSLIAVGGAGFLGAIIRYYTSEKLKKHTKIPLGTLFVNIIGSFMLGLLCGLHAEGIYYLMIGIGLLGALTTFSTLNVELIKLQKYRRLYYFYFTATYVGGLLVAFIGYMLGKVF
ncbi:fluoride efflux transporter FluC [Psychrobacillus sp. FSL K6-1267]|uniref:fluoride efflux transporter FluC n=1 Tax=Psychrobacillus sp. FSL K6-1267 TaxID=2921543 RepID=UPI0030F8DC17